MITVQQAVADILDESIKDVTSLQSAQMAFEEIETAMIEAFAWHPIERADEFGLRTPPPGKKWGPRVIVMMNDGPAVAYWDPDQVQPDGKPVAAPAPYWRAVQKQAGWSRRATVTHFLRPYAVA